MSKRIPVLLKAYSLLTVKSFLIFWLIFTAVYALVVRAELSRPVYAQSDGMMIGAMSVIYLFMAVLAVYVAKETFRFSLGMGFTRKEYCFSAFLFFLLLSGLNSLLQTAAYLLFELKTISLPTRLSIHYFSFSGMQAYSGIEAAWIHFMVTMVFLSVAFTLTVLYLRYGKTFLWVVSAVFLFWVLSYTSLEWWFELFIIERMQSLAGYSLRFFLIVLAVFLLVRASLKKTDVPPAVY